MATITRLKARWVSIPVNWLKTAAPALLAVAKSKTHPILDNIHVSYFNGKTRLVATDLDQALCLIHRDNQPEDDAERIMVASAWVLRNFQGALLPLSVLRMVLKDADKNTPIRMDWTGPYKGEVQWVAKGIAMRRQFDTLDVDEFPMPPHPNPEGHRMYWAADEHKAMGTIAHAMSEDETRYVLNGIFFDHDGTLTATDGRRLSCIPSKSGAINPLPMRPFILPSKSVMLRPPWDKIAAGGIATIEESQFYLEADNLIYTCKTIEGNYPNWRQVVPDKPPAIWIDFSESVDACLAAFKTFGTMSKKPLADSVRISVDGNSVKFSSKDAAETTLPVKVTGHNATVFRACYNLQFLCEAIGNGFTMFGITAPDKPAIGKHPDGGTHVLMPMREN